MYLHAQGISTSHYLSSFKEKSQRDSSAFLPKSAELPDENGRATVAQLNALCPQRTGR
jgi:hypothetical protein